MQPEQKHLLVCGILYMTFCLGYQNKIKIHLYKNAFACSMKNSFTLPDILLIKLRLVKCLLVPNAILSQLQI